MNWTAIGALMFDCYGTLIDWESGLLAALRPWVRRNGLSMSDEALLNAYADLEAAAEEASPSRLYPEILQTVLRGIAARIDARVTAEELEGFGMSVADWPAFDDSPTALRYLQRHYRLVIVSNVDRASFAHSQAKLGVEFDAVITAEDVGSYKPNPRHFECALDRLREMGVPRDRVLHVAQSLYHDHVPAKRLGLPTVWINRRATRNGWGATRAPGVEVRPDLVVDSMAGLVAVHRASGTCSE